MSFKPFSKKSLKTMAAALAVVFFSENVILVPLAQAQIWDDRKVESPVLLASLPQIPTAIATPFSPKALHDLGINPALGSATKGALISQRLPEWIPAAIAPHATIHDISLSQNPNAKTVLLLQDAHLHFEAQTHIAGAIDALARSSQQRSQKLLVGLEGADISRINFSVYNQTTNRAAQRLAAEALVKANVLNGVEFAAIGFLGEGAGGPQSLPFEVTGVEQQSEVDANVKALRDSVPTKKKMDLGLEAYRRGLQAVQEKVLSGELKTLVSKTADYEEGRVSLPDYVMFLDSIQPASSPNIRELIEAALLEGSIDFKKVEKERNQILEKLIARMSELETKTLLQYSALYRARELSYTAYYDHLKELAQRHDVSLSQYPEMNLYIQYVLKSESIDSNLLFSELREFESKVGQSLAKTTEQKEVLALAKDFYLLSKLNQHILTEDEWHEYESRRADIHQLSKRMYKLEMVVPDELKGLEMYLSILEAFYNSAIVRNETMVDKLMAANTNARVSVLVAGGFHTQGLFKELKKHDVNILTLSPKITKVEENTLSTIDVLASGQMPLDRLFAGERLFLPLAPQTVVNPIQTEAVVLSFADAVAKGKGSHGNIEVTESSSGNLQTKDGRKFKIKDLSSKIEWGILGFVSLASGFLVAAAIIGTIPVTAVAVSVGVVIALGGVYWLAKSNFKVFELQLLRVDGESSVRRGMQRAKRTSDSEGPYRAGKISQKLLIASGLLSAVIAVISVGYQMFRKPTQEERFQQALAGKLSDENYYLPEQNAFRRLEIILDGIRFPQIPEEEARKLYSEAFNNANQIKEDPLLKAKSLIKIGSSQTLYGKGFEKEGQDLFQRVFNDLVELKKQDLRKAEDGLVILAQALVERGLYKKVELIVSDEITTPYNQVLGYVILAHGISPFPGRDDEKNDAFYKAIEAAGKINSIEGPEGRDAAYMYIAVSAIKEAHTRFLVVAGAATNKIKNEKLNKILLKDISNQRYSQYWYPYYPPSPSEYLDNSSSIITKIIAFLGVTLTAAIAQAAPPKSNLQPGLTPTDNVIFIVAMMLVAAIVLYRIWRQPKTVAPVQQFDEEAAIARSETRVRDVLQKTNGQRLVVIGASNFTTDKDSVLRLFQMRKPGELIVMTGGEWAAGLGMRVEYAPHKKGLGVSEEEFQQLLDAFEQNMGAADPTKIAADLKEARETGVFVPRPLMEKLGVSAEDYKANPGLKALNEAIQIIAPEQDHPIYKFEADKQAKGTGFGRIELEVEGQKVPVYSHLYFLDLLVKDKLGNIRVVPVYRNAPVISRGAEIIGFGPDTLATWGAAMAQSAGAIQLRDINELSIPTNANSYPIDLKERMDRLVKDGVVKITQENELRTVYALVMPKNIVDARYDTERKGFDRAVQKAFNEHQGKLQSTVSASSIITPILTFLAVVLVASVAQAGQVDGFSQFISDPLVRLIAIAAVLISVIAGPVIIAANYTLVKRNPNELRQTIFTRFWADYSPKLFKTPISDELFLIIGGLVGAFAMGVFYLIELGQLLFSPVMMAWDLLKKSYDKHFPHSFHGLNPVQQLLNFIQAHDTVDNLVIALANHLPSQIDLAAGVYTPRYLTQDRNALFDGIAKIGALKKSGADKRSIEQTIEKVAATILPFFSALQLAEVFMKAAGFEKMEFSESAHLQLVADDLANNYFDGLKITIQEWNTPSRELYNRSNQLAFVERAPDYDETGEIIIRVTESAHYEMTEELQRFIQKNITRNGISMDFDSRVRLAQQMFILKEVGSALGISDAELHAAGFGPASKLPSTPVALNKVALVGALKTAAEKAGKANKFKASVKHPISHQRINPIDYRAAQVTAAAALGAVHPILHERFGKPGVLNYEFVGQANNADELQGLNLLTEEFASKLTVKRDTGLMSLQDTPRLVKLFNAIAESVKKGAEWINVQMLWDHISTQIGKITTLPVFDRTDDMALFVKTYAKRRMSLGSPYMGYMGTKAQLEESLVTYKQYIQEKYVNGHATRNMDDLRKIANDLDLTLDDLRDGTLKLVESNIEPKEVQVDSGTAYDATEVAKDILTRTAPFGIQKVVFLSDSRTFIWDAALAISSVLYISGYVTLQNRIENEIYATIFA